MSIIDTDQRFTPEHVLDVVRRFAPIGLDPCTVKENPTKAAIAIYLDEAHPNSCGLKRNWSSSVSRGQLVYVNPPYSRGELARWVDKIVYESRWCNDIIALIPSDLGTEAGRLVAQTADAVCFVRSRLKFSTPTGELEQGAKQPSIMPYWGGNKDRFARVFAALGVVWSR